MFAHKQKSEINDLFTDLISHEVQKATKIASKAAFLGEPRDSFYKTIKAETAFNDPVQNKQLLLTLREKYG